ncbi:MAG: D-alanyl-D-alanine carboxypeptidase/D-alanyl-D-alanine-endopeptidase [Bryobacteraceae bacterium]|nr:D-alanyl-D-alanine carboxypeptidase/D-alanyl-D-alanine-endopeptidase [Bryobacteraceae bacterium]
MRSAILLLTAAVACIGADLAERVPALIDSVPAAKQSFWGIRVIDAQSGQLLYALNEDRFFVPASNTKLFTSSLALRRLGPDYKFRTRVAAPAKPDAEGRIAEIRLLGGGDPNLSARMIPYNKDEKNPDALAALRKLAEQVAASGVKVIAGDVIGDDTAYVSEPFPPGWGLDDPIYEYGAPVSALTLNDNAFEVTVFPGAEAGAPGSLALNPPVEYFTIVNRTLTADTGKTQLSFRRVPGSRELIVTGTVVTGQKIEAELVAVDDPALYAATAFRQLLEQRGIRIDGITRAAHRRVGDESPVFEGEELAVHESAPLSQILVISNKVSQNLHTELVLREISRVANGIGSRREGLKMIAAYLKEIGVEEGQWNFEDASGMSRLGLVTPATVSKLLQAMYAHPLYDLWLTTLPIGGFDGTLEKRFDKLELAQRIHAKTGSLSHVAALSGYALRPDGKTYIFSILVNNFQAEAKVIRATMDKVALAFLE